MDIQKFVAQRNDIMQLCHRLKVIIGGIDNVALKKQLTDRLEDREKKLLTDTFKIVVVGEFSRGKSTFINAVLGSRILPSKSTPTTAIINIISYGDEKNFVLYYRDTEETRTLTEDEFRSIVADDDDDAEIADNILSEVNRIKYAKIDYPTEICRDGIELIDTPGTNDLDQMREELTFNFIPEADAAIFLLSAEQILSKSEIAFLKNHILKNDIKKVFFVINFKDRLDEPEAEGERVIAKAKEGLLELIDEPRVYLVSSKLALNYRRAKSGETVKGQIPKDLTATGFGQFENSLAEFLMRERADEKIRRHVASVIQISNDFIDQSIKVRDSLIGLNAAQLAEKIEEFRPKLKKMQIDCHRVFDDLRFHLGLIADDVSYTYRSGLERIARQAVSEVNYYEGELQCEAVAQFIEEKISPLQKENELSARQQLTARLQEASNSAYQKLQTIFADDNLSVSKQLVVIQQGQSNLPAPTNITLDRVSSDDTSFVGGGLVLGGLFMAASFPFIAIPMAVFGGKYFLRQFESYKRNDFLAKVSDQVRQRYREIIPDQVEQLKRELQSNLIGIANNIDQMIEDKITAAESELERMLRERKAQEKSDEKERNALMATWRQITDIQNELKAVIDHKKI